MPSPFLSKIMSNLNICGFAFRDSSYPPEYVSNLESSYSVDFYLEVKEHVLIGLQSKPRTSKGLYSSYGHKGINRSNYRKFELEFGGPVIEYDHINGKHVFFHPHSGSKMDENEFCAYLIKLHDTLNNLTP